MDEAFTQELENDFAELLLGGPEAVDAQAIVPRARTSGTPATLSTDEGSPSTSQSSAKKKNKKKKKRVEETWEAEGT